MVQWTLKTVSDADVEDIDLVQQMSPGMRMINLSPQRETARVCAGRSDLKSIQATSADRGQIHPGQADQANEDERVAFWHTLPFSVIRADGTGVARWDNGTAKIKRMG